MLKLIEGINSIVKGTKDREAEKKVDLATSIKMFLFSVVFGKRYKVNIVTYSSCYLSKRSRNKKNSL